VTVTSAVGGATTFGIGCKYSLGKDTCVRAKVDNSSVVRGNILISTLPTARPSVAELGCFIPDPDPNIFILYPVPNIFESGFLL
jgi:hypothetical protein